MEINPTNNGAATFALKKALAMPNVLLQLIQPPAASDEQPLAQTNSQSQAIDIATVTGKGKIIDVMA